MEPDRLNGWKEIAAHLRKGVRTVQRWEKDYGLPVHRIGDAGGEIVYAFKSEIAAWEVNAGPDEESPRNDVPAGGDLRSAGAVTQVDVARAALPTAVGAGQLSSWVKWRRSIYFGLVVFGCAAAALAVVSTMRPVLSSSPPADWSVQAQVLTVFGSQGQRLWSYKFEVPVSDSAYMHRRENKDGALGTQPVQFVDLDADGAREVVVQVLTDPSAEGHLLCFEADGRIRFRFQMRADVRFGDAEYSSPWPIYGVFPIRTGEGLYSLWVTFTHGRWFPSPVVELDSAGSVKQRYWSNGFVSLVTSLRWHGDDYIMIGAANNEHLGASLALFDRHQVRGSAPAAKRQYSCTSCGDGAPEHFLVFPGMCIGLTGGGTADVMDVRGEAHDGLAVLVTHGLWDVPGTLGPKRPGVWYELAAGLELNKVEVLSEFRRVHEVLRQRSYLDHAFTAETHTGLPVVRWDNGQFREVADKHAPE